MIGDERKFVSALVVPNLELLKAYAAEQNIEYKSDEELLAHPLIYKKMEARIEEKQKHLAAFEKIKRFTLLAHPFSMESGELTDTLKLRRKVVAEHYAEAIEKMYK